MEKTVTVPSARRKVSWLTSNWNVADERRAARKSRSCSMTPVGVSHMLMPVEMAPIEMLLPLTE